MSDSFNPTDARIAELLQTATLPARHEIQALVDQLLQHLLFLRAEIAAMTRFRGHVFRCFWVTMVCSAASSVCDAQGTTYGGSLGYSNAGFRIDDEEGRALRTAGFRPVPRIGVQGGLWVHWFARRRLGVQSELHFVQKGARYERGPSTMPGGNASILIDYLELPVLLRLHLRDPAASGLRPFLLAGSGVAFRTGCSFEASAGGTSNNQPCVIVNSPARYRTVDASAVLGGGVAFRVRARELTIGMRYAAGLIPISDSGSNTRNTNFSSLFGIAF